jgi:hypothetical protein
MRWQIPALVLSGTIVVGGIIAADRIAQSIPEIAATQQTSRDARTAGPPPRARGSAPSMLEKIRVPTWGWVLGWIVLGFWIAGQIPRHGQRR